MKLIKMKKQYIETGNKELLNEINDYIDNVINRDKHYFSKIHKYKFSREELRFLIFQKGSKYYGRCNREILKYDSIF